MQRGVPGMAQLDVTPPARGRTLHERLTLVAFAAVRGHLFSTAIHG